MNNDSFQFGNVTTSQTFSVLCGGAYAVTVSATFGGGNINIQKLSLDGSTYVDLKAAFDNAGTEQDDTVGKFTANGSKILILAPGIHQATVTTATAVYIEITRAPLA